MRIETNDYALFLSWMLGAEVKPSGSRRPRMRRIGRGIRQASRLLERVDDAAQILAGAEPDEIRGGQPIGRLADRLDDLADRLAGPVAYTHRYVPVQGGSFDLPRVEFRAADPECSGVCDARDGMSWDCPLHGPIGRKPRINWTDAEHAAVEALREVEPDA